MVSNTLVCEVSRLLTDADTSPQESDAGDWSEQKRTGLRMIDLMCLIEAVALHDKLYTLPARLDSDDGSLEMRRALVREGILHELDTSDVHLNISAAIVERLANVENPVKIAGASDEIGSPIDFESGIRGQVEGFLSEMESDEAYDDFSEASDWSKASSFDELGRSVIGWLEYSYSGAYESCTSVLRDMYYIFSSEHFGLSYWPEFTRADFCRKFPNYFQDSFRVQLYKKLADAFRTTVTDVFDDVSSQVVFIPPFSTLVLERSRNSDEIIPQILAVREEYVSLRKRLGILDSERRNARTIKDRKTIRDQQRRLINVAGTAFERPHTISLEGIVRYVPEVIKPAISPLDPTKYGAGLLLQPMQWLIEWWRRRPVSKLFDLAGKLERIEEYQALATKVFGSKASALSTFMSTMN